MSATRAAGCTVTYDAGAAWVRASWTIRESGFAARRAGESWARRAPAPGSNQGSGIGLFERHLAARTDFSRGRANGHMRGAFRYGSGRNSRSREKRAVKKPGAPTPDSLSLVSCVEVRRSSVFV